MLGVDVGGTFTDVVAVRDGRIITTKVPTQRTDTENSVLEGAEQVGVEDATVFNHASTVGLNAIITRKLPKIAFLTTEGHRDILDVGPHLAAAGGADRPRLAALVRRRGPPAGPALPAPRRQGAPAGRRRRR